MLNKIKESGIKLLKLKLKIVGAIAVVLALVGLIREGDRYLVHKSKERVKASLVIILGDLGQGSGVVVKSDKYGSLILTNKHVCLASKTSEIKERIKKGKKVRVKLRMANKLSPYFLFGIKNVKENTKRNPVITEGQVVKISQNTDLCLIHVLEVDLTPANIANTLPGNGDELYGYSNPIGVEGVFSSGTALDYIYIWDMLYQITTVYGMPGSSGSGIFNTDGKLVGLVSLGGNGKLLMVPLHHVKLFLNDLNL